MDARGRPAFPEPRVPQSRVRAAVWHCAESLSPGSPSPASPSPESRRPRGAAHRMRRCPSFSFVPCAPRARTAEIRRETAPLRASGAAGRGVASNRVSTRDRENFPRWTGASPDLASQLQGCDLVHADFWEGGQEQTHALDSSSNSSANPLAPGPAGPSQSPHPRLHQRGDGWVLDQQGHLVKVLLCISCPLGAQGRPGQTHGTLSRCLSRLAKKLLKL